MADKLYDNLMKLVEKGGGAAFPFQIEFDNGSSVSYPGMTLRDYLAGRAMQATITADGATHMLSEDHVAIEAYKFADAMLRARDNG
jgi:hypothetical protein